jgi:hypothetical protein
VGLKAVRDMLREGDLPLKLARLHARMEALLASSAWTISSMRFTNSGGCGTSLDLPDLVLLAAHVPA